MDWRSDIHALDPTWKDSVDYYVESEARYISEYLKKVAYDHSLLKCFPSCGSIDKWVSGGLCLLCGSDGVPLASLDKIEEKLLARTYRDRRTVDSNLKYITHKLRNIYQRLGAGEKQLENFDHAWRVRRLKSTNDFDKAEKEASERYSNHKETGFLDTNNQRKSANDAAKKKRDAAKKKRRELNKKKRDDAKKAAKLAKDKAATMEWTKRWNEDAAKKKRDAAKKGKKLLDVLITSGLPKHIEIDYLISELEPMEYAKLFDFLRSSGAPYQSVNEFDILNDIDYYVFTGIISKEDGLFLINHRNHIELMQDRFSKKLKLDKNNAMVNSTFVRWLLIERGFNEFPESVKKVLKGADVDSVVIMDGIKGKDVLVNSQEEKKKGRLSNLSNNKEYSDADVNDEGQKKSATRRKGRFADD